MVDSKDDMRNKLLVNEYSFLRNSSIPTVASIVERYRQRAKALNTTTRIALKIKLK